MIINILEGNFWMIERKIRPSTCGFETNFRPFRKIFYANPTSNVQKMINFGQKKETFQETSLLASVRKTWSEWPDSNGRPLAPHARMLANCTTPRLLSRCKNTTFLNTITIFNHF